MITFLVGKKISDRISRFCLRFKGAWQFSQWVILSNIHYCTRHIVLKTFHLLVILLIILFLVIFLLISFFTNFIHNSFCQKVNLSIVFSTYHLFLSTSHFVNKYLCQKVILSTSHFVKKSFCQKVILSTSHFVKKSFCQKVILSIDFIS
jgi:hypothetical protein